MASKSRRQPLLSRSQLRLLIWVLPIVILLLSLLGPKPAPEVVISADGARRIYQHRVPQQPTFRLHLIAPHAPALDAPSQLRQHLISQALLVRLRQPDELGNWLSAQGWTAQLHSHLGYRLLQLESSEPFTDDALQTLLLQLQTPPALDWPTLLQRVQAEHYMLRQDAEAWLTSPPSHAAQQPIQPHVEYAQLLQPSGWRITLTGPELLPLTLPIASPMSPPAPTESPPLLLEPLPVMPTPDSPLQLHRWALPEVNSVEAFAQLLLGRELVIQSVSLWLEQRLNTAPGRRNGYSLRWDATSHGGQATLILQGEAWPDLPGWLPQQPGDEQMAAARERILIQLQSDTSLQQWMDLLALYQLPPDTLQRLPAQLEALQLPTMQQWLQSALLSDYYHTLSLPH
jgi:hypothetical protein